MKWYGKYGGKESRIVIRYGKYGRKVSRKVKRFGKYGRQSKLNSEIIWKIQKKIVKWYGNY